MKFLPKSLENRENERTPQETENETEIDDLYSTRLKQGCFTARGEKIATVFVQLQIELVDRSLEP